MVRLEGWGREGGQTLDSTSNNCPQISLSVNAMQITVPAGSFLGKLDNPILSQQRKNKRPVNGKAGWEEGRGRARSARMETGYIAMATKNKMTGSRQGATQEHTDSE